MQLISTNVNSRLIDTPLRRSTLLNTLLTRGVPLVFSAFLLALSGCAFPPTVVGESPLLVTPRQFQSVLLTLNPGVFEDLRTFDKIHIVHFGDVIEQELKSKGVKTGVVLLRPTDFDRSALHQAAGRLRPSHIVRVIAIQRTTSTNWDRITWLIQVEQQDTSKSELAYVPAFRFSISGDACIERKTWGSLEKELSCFRELSGPIFSTLLKKGFYAQQSQQRENTTNQDNSRILAANVL